MESVMIFVCLFGIGVFTGLRCFTPIAVICWMTMLGRLPVDEGWMGLAANRIAVALFSLGAVGEYVGDKLPNTPARTKPPGLIGRMIFGGLCAAVLASGVGFSLVSAVVIGMVGAIAGTFGGWFVRTRTVAALKCPDLPVALVEDLIAIGGSVAVCLLIAR
jgi:uncharacterized membrane protein